jgi:hypothetical protein
MSGRHSTCAEAGGDLLARGDVELEVDLAQLVLDRAHAEEQRLGDVTVGQAARRHLRDAALARGERLEAGDGAPARARAGGLQLLLGAVGQAARPARVGEVEAKAQRLAARRAPRSTSARARARRAGEAASTAAASCSSARPSAPPAASPAARSADPIGCAAPNGRASASSSRASDPASSGRPSASSASAAPDRQPSMAG